MVMPGSGTFPIGPVSIGRILGEWLGFAKPDAKGLASDYAKLILIDDLDERSEQDHLLTTILVCPPDKCQRIRRRLSELQPPSIYSYY